MYTAISLFASLKETYESQLNKHLCLEPREGRVGVSLGDQSGLQSPEMDLPPAQGLKNITSGGSHEDQGLSLGHELGVSQGHYSNAQSAFLLQMVLGAQLAGSTVPAQPPSISVATNVTEHPAWPFLLYRSATGSCVVTSASLSITLWSL